MPELVARVLALLRRTHDSCVEEVLPAAMIQWPVGRHRLKKCLTLHVREM